MMFSSSHCYFNILFRSSLDKKSLKRVFLGSCLFDSDSSMVKLYTITLSQLHLVHEARFTCCIAILWDKKLITEKKNFILHFNV
jgi:hypothetical protein